MFTSDSHIAVHIKWPEQHHLFLEPVDFIGCESPPLFILPPQQPDLLLEVPDLRLEAADDQSGVHLLIDRHDVADHGNTLGESAGADALIDLLLLARDSGHHGGAAVTPQTIF